LAPELLATSTCTAPKSPAARHPNPR
jgi:hypothetical protein